MVWNVLIPGGVVIVYFTVSTIPHYEFITRALPLQYDMSKLVFRIIIFFIISFACKLCLFYC